MEKKYDDIEQADLSEVQWIIDNKLNSSKGDVSDDSHKCLKAVVLFLMLISLSGCHKLDKGITLRYMVVGYFVMWSAKNAAV